MKGMRTATLRAVRVKVSWVRTGRKGTSWRRKRENILRWRFTEFGTGMSSPDFTNHKGRLINIQPPWDAAESDRLLYHRDISSGAHGAHGARCRRWGVGVFHRASAHPHPTPIFFCP